MAKTKKKSNIIQFRPREKKAPTGNWLGGVRGVRQEERSLPVPMPEKKTGLPWYALAESKPLEQKEEVVLNNKTITEINAVKWLKKLMNVCVRIGETLLDPEILEYTPVGSVVMRWRVGPRVLEAIILENDVLGTLSLVNEYEEDTFIEVDGFSQGSIKEEEQIEMVWRWLIDKKKIDGNFLQELISLSIRG